jgi:hypothetical protein
VRVIELKLQLEGPIRQTAALAQEGYRLIHDRDKVHPVSSLRLRRQRAPSLTGALPCLVFGLRAHTRVHHSISDAENAAGNTGVTKEAQGIRLVATFLVFTGACQRLLGKGLRLPERKMTARLQEVHGPFE